MRSGVLAVLLALPPLALTGCEAPGSANPGPTSGCVTDADCKGDRVCHEAACVFPSSLGAVTSGAVGAPCIGDGACGDPGASCVLDYPDGYCVVDGCAACPAGSTCVADGEAEVCMRACTSELDCRTGYGCTGFAEVTVCYPLPGGGTTAPGEACAANAECAELPAVCVGEWPGGACVPIDCVDRGCPEGTRCHPDAAVAADGACLPTCATDADCRPDYVCLTALEGAGACVPRCDQVDGLCEAGQICDVDSGRCRSLSP